LSVLVEHSVDGLLIAPTRNRIRTIAALHRRGLPIVFLDRSLAGLDIPTVSIDFHTATVQLVCHLVATGRRFIGIIAGPTRVAMAPLRAAVVMEAAAAAGIAVPKRNVPIDDFTVEGGAPAFHELHKRGLPLTIVSLNNRMAEGVIEMMLMLGVTMGDDVSLASFDDIAFFRLVRPSITAVVQPIAQMAAVAFDFLTRRMGGERAESVLLEAGLAIPASTLGRSGTTPTP
jgi:LacI family transcriptional regulator